MRRAMLLWSVVMVSACGTPTPCTDVPAHVCEEGVDHFRYVPMDGTSVAGCAFALPATCALGCASVDAGCTRSFVQGPLGFPVALTTAAIGNDGGTVVTLADATSSSSLRLELRNHVQGGLVQTGEVQAQVVSPAGVEVGVSGSIDLNAAATSSEHWGGTFSLTFDGGTSLTGGFDLRP